MSGIARFLCFAIALGTVLLASGCQERPPAPPHTGIRGQMERGPLEPVAQQGESNREPFQGTVRVENQQSETVTTVEADEEGNFQVRLVPGQYRLVPIVPEERGVMYAKPQQIMVREGEVTEVTILFDTGMR